MMQCPPKPATPLAFALKRHILQHAHRFWCEIEPAAAASAPIYVFPDQERFDDEEIEQLAIRNLAGILKAPHPYCIFELPERDYPGGSLASYVRATETGVESFLFRYDPTTRRWSDVLVATEFLPDGYAESNAHPQYQEPDQYRPPIEVATSMVWRALGLLSAGMPLVEHQLSPLRRTRFAKAGVRGWTYRVAEIRPATIAAALAAHRGSHASPRWHIRRGHWRQLADGRRVFVRECAVGDASRGGVVKDYHVQIGEAA